MDTDNITSSSTVDDDVDSEEYEVCFHCGEKPCFWLNFKEEILSSTVKNMDDCLVSNSLLRKKAYQMFVYFKYGRLGKGNRVRIPECVLDGIRKVWPETDQANYMGHNDDYEEYNS